MEKLNPKIYPNLAQIQEKDPNWLIEMLTPLAEKNHMTLEEAATILESDLAGQNYYEPTEN